MCIPGTTSVFPLAGDQQAALTVIYNHAFKGEQECKVFDLRLDRKFSGPDASTFVAGAKAQGGAYPSVAEKTTTKYLNGPSIGKVKHGLCVGCESPYHQAMDCLCKNKDEVCVKIDRAVADVRASGKARGDETEGRKKTARFPQL